ncbi:MAG: methanogenesis marker 17 protein [Candidatus Methanofastidiosa archaeon]|nr:methanogenesis marker 17 protein [Candidatus Methanofastidiosa archaeon]
MMEVEVRGGTREENESLRKLTEEIFKDSGLAKKQSKVLIVVDIGIPAFYVGIKFKKDVEPIKVGDIASIREQSGKTKLQINEERYYDQVIEKLGTFYGKENVEQSERNIIYINSTDENVRDIVIYDLTEEIRERTIDVLWSILPEGFKVRHFKHFEDGFILVSTDIPQIREFYNVIEDIQKEFGGSWDV